MLKRVVRRVRRVMSNEVLDELVYLREQVTALREQVTALRAEQRELATAPAPMPIGLGLHGGQLEQILVTLAFAGPSMDGPAHGRER
jgi:hypothetical protein